MTSRDRVRQILAFKEPDRVGTLDRFWIDTLVRWQSEGMPADVVADDYFEFDFDTFSLDSSLRLPERLIEDTPEYTIREDKHGFTAKQWKDRSGALGYLDHVIKTRDDWARHRDRLDVDFGTGCRVNTEGYFPPFTIFPSWEEMRATSVEIERREKYIIMDVYGPNEATWRKHGFEASLEDMALDPAFMMDMFAVHTNLCLATMQKALDQGIAFDGVFLVEDLGYRSGTYFSPRTYREVLFPFHRRFGDFCAAHGLTLFLHSDGDIRAIIPTIIDAGVRVLQPLEAKAGLDVVELKQEYGRDLAFMGNIDATKMAGTRDEIEMEVRRKVLAAKKDGGYIYHSDHSVPPEISFEDYRYLLSLVRKYGSY